MNKKSKISIIIPTYNEVNNIGPLIERLQSLPLNKEIIVVDDNSNDGTIDVVKRLSERYNNVRLLVRPRKMGLGSAYKNGFRLARGDIIVQMDGDLSHDPSELPRLIKGLESADVVIGSRYVKGGRIVSWGPLRRLISLGANLLARLILRLRMHDCTSGYRAFRRKAFREIMNLNEADGFAFQVETIYIASRLKLRVSEVPCTFYNRTSGKSKLDLREMLKFLMFLFSMRLKGWQVKA